MLGDARHPVVPKGWPAFAALAAVVVMALAVVVVDLVIDRETARRTNDLVDDALRSVSLADDMRKDAHLLATSRDPALRAAAIEQLDYDVREYDSLATEPRERDEWQRLQKLLVQLQNAPASAATPNIAEIEASIDRIVEINRREAADAVALITHVNHRGILIDVVTGLITLALAAAIALWLRRALGRERALIRGQLAQADEQRRDLEAFAGRVAHDLRGPLQPLRGYAELIAMTVPEARTPAERVSRAVERMSAIIDDLLSLSVSGHPGAGETTVAPVVRDVVEEVDLRGGHVELALDDSCARCTSSVLHQLLGNLVTNAVKYRSPSRPLELVISCERHANMVDVAVVDNGIGMDTTTAAHVFEPFFRADGVATKVPGHGLGLAIVKRTVDALGGTCELDSAIDRGTRITLHLPAA